ncbi:MAG: hypothetical protein GKS05_03735 [Nitrospirales bacterium]|nr:hypothetical protein [Nitrospirales bacterium]
MEGLRFEKRGEGSYYKTILHIGSCFVPISDETFEELTNQQGVSAAHVLSLFLDKVGYSSYLTDQIQAELSKVGDLEKQAEWLQHALQEL